MDEQTTVAKRADTRAEVIAILEANAKAIRGFGATALYLFGSAARDQMGPDSDVDMYMEYDPEGPFSFVELIDLQEHLKRALGREIGLATRAGLHPRLKAHIESTAMRVL